MMCSGLIPPCHALRVFVYTCVECKAILLLAFLISALLWIGWRENCRSRVSGVTAVSSLMHVVHVVWQWICNMQPCNTQGTCANVITQPPSQGSPNSICGSRGPRFLSLPFLMLSVFYVQLVQDEVKDCIRQTQVNQAVSWWSCSFSRKLKNEMYS